MTDRYVGSAVRRREDARLLQGLGRYTDDTTPPRALHLYFVRSPHAHARIVSIDSSSAMSVPGVTAVVTASDLANVNAAALTALIPGATVPTKDLLARDKVLYVGDPVAAVLAADRQTAVDAAEQVQVEYEILPANANPERALESGAPLIHEGTDSNLAFRFERGSGEVEAALDAAEAVARVRLPGKRVSAMPLEPRAFVAGYDPQSDGLNVSLGTQMLHGTRTSLARVLGLGEHRIRLQMQEMGGAFGARSALHAEEVVVAFLAWKGRCTVSWCETRRESLSTMSHGRGLSVEVALGVTREGQLTGIDVKALVDVGAFAHPIAFGPPNNVATLTAGAYRLPRARCSVTAVYTNAVPVAPYRGAGRPDAALAVERAVDEAARLIGMDPAELRRRNFIDASSFPYTTPVGATYDSGNYAAAMEKTLELVGYDHWRAEQARLREEGRYLGIGLCSFVEPAGAMFWESGIVRVEASGKVTLLSGAAPHGQGHQTTLAQVVADELDVAIEDVAVLYGDSAVVPVGRGSFGSRTAAIGGSAALLAARAVKQRMLRIAANLLEVGTDDVEPRDGRFQVVGAPTKGMTFAEVAAAAHAGRGIDPGQPFGLDATDTFNLRGMLFPFGTHLAVVEVDVETGRISVLRYVAVDDCGTVINPLLVEGQMHGGLAQGIGQAMLEELIYDEEGQLVTASLMDYAVPRASDLPRFELSHTVTPSPLNPLGAKGVGEAGAIGAPAAMLNAVLDALAPLGVKDLTMPLTPARVWSAIQGTR